MDDDFNTGGAIGDLFELVRALNKFVDDEKLETTGKSDAQKVAALEARHIHAQGAGRRAGPVPHAARGANVVAAATSWSAS